MKGKRTARIGITPQHNTWHHSTIHHATTHRPSHHLKSHIISHPGTHVRSFNVGSDHLSVVQKNTRGVYRGHDVHTLGADTGKGRVRASVTARMRLG